MQDPSTAFQTIKPPFPEQEKLKCPRCDSTNTKFCYYNNYNLSQPRHFCKNCRRYWTKGGALRNIPVGGGSRKNTKRSSNPKRGNPDPNAEPAQNSRRTPGSPSSMSSMTATSTPPSIPNEVLDQVQDPTRRYGIESDQDRNMLSMGGTFCSLLASNSQFGSIFEGLNPSGSDLKLVQMGGFGEDLNSSLNAGSDNDPNMDVRCGNSNNNGGGGGSGDSEGYLQSGDWGNTNGWPDLAIYTPGSGFQ